MLSNCFNQAFPENGFDRHKFHQNNINQYYLCREQWRMINLQTIHHIPFIHTYVHTSDRRSNQGLANSANLRCKSRSASELQKCVINYINYAASALPRLLLCSWVSPLFITNVWEPKITKDRVVDGCYLTSNWTLISAYFSFFIVVVVVLYIFINMVIVCRCVVLLWRFPLRSMTSHDKWMTTAAAQLRRRRA